MSGTCRETGMFISGMATMNDSIGIRVDRHFTSCAVSCETAQETCPPIFEWLQRLQLSHMREAAHMRFEQRSANGKALNVGV